jgi:hypothetical protein
MSEVRGTSTTTYPGHVHFFRVIMDDGQHFLTGPTHGPDPFHAANGSTLIFDPEEDAVRVSGASGEHEFPQGTRHVFFSPDGGHVAFIYLQRNEWHVAIDGEEVAVFESLRTAMRTWSLDGTRFTYAAFFKEGAFREEIYIMIKGERYAQPARVR